MKLPIIILSVLFSRNSFSQETFDSSWIQNKTRFHLQIASNEKSTTDLNSKLILARDQNIILTDSILCAYLSVEHHDINADGYQDILVYQSSGARSNETANLFLYNKKQNCYTRVAHYNDWPNMDTVGTHGLLYSTILTGTVTYKFFMLNNSGKLLDLKIEVKDDNLDGKEFDQALIRAKKKVKLLRNGA